MVILQQQSKQLVSEKKEMNYIVFDLEWNQCPYGKDRENKRLTFEIIEF